VLTFPDHQTSVTGVAIKADGKVGFSAGADNQLRSWNASGDMGGKAVKALGAHTKPILKLVQHPKLPLLATCSEDMTVKLWNPDSGANLKTLTGHTDQVFAVAISSDGNLVASGTWNGEVKVWKVGDGMVVKAISATPGLVAAAPK
jgi:WD40 repeat protein